MDICRGLANWAQKQLICLLSKSRVSQTRRIQIWLNLNWSFFRQIIRESPKFWILRDNTKTGIHSRKRFDPAVRMPIPKTGALAISACVISEWRKSGRHPVACGLPWNCLTVSTVSNPRLNRKPESEPRLNLSMSGLRISPARNASKTGRLS